MKIIDAEPYTLEEIKNNDPHYSELIFVNVDIEVEDIKRRFGCPDILKDARCFLIRHKDADYDYDRIYFSEEKIIKDTSLFYKLIFEF